MSDSLVSNRLSPSSIRSQVQREAEPATKVETPGQVVATDEKADPLPKPGDSYKAEGRHGNKPELTIHFVTKDFAYEGFSYADLERVRLVPTDKPGVGPSLVVRFNGSVVTEVTIGGRNLHGLYNWISLHKLPWAWEHPAPAHFTDEKATVITRIRIDSIDR